MTWVPICTTPCTTGCCRFPMTCWSIRRTARALCAGSSFPPDTVSSLGDQRQKLNYALQPMSKEEFIRLVTADQPDAPDYFTYDAILNTRERATLEKSLEQALHPIQLDEVLRMGDAGAQILDVREPSEFAKSHMARSINIAAWADSMPRGRVRCSIV